ncbi:Na+/H+ antiporter subunit E [Pseudonocardia acaciae]|uniref:Na+/H+ antiporter subunit E n=1 Tax=Pseudonocardia acaciae TaxID=551276 RepID=UPI00068434FD|nr:Na+/H+ antiporter subunit E [Pseudonocardia acaciae]
MRRIGWLWASGFLAWVLLTGTFTVEHLAFGVGAAALVAAGLAPLYPTAGLRPRALARAVGTAVVTLGRVVVANIRLAARIWRSGRPSASGMVVVRTSVRSVAGLAAVGVMSSLVVDNQLVDVDRHGGELQYHTVTGGDRR